MTGRFLSINIAAGKTLTLAAQPRFPNGRVLSGQGQIRFQGAGPFWVLPEWWMGSSSNSDANIALKKIASACAKTRCYVILTGSLQLSGSFQVPDNIRLWASSGARLTKLSSSSSGSGLIFGPGGDYSSGYGPMELPNFDGLTGTSIQVIGTSNLQIYVPSLGSSAEGIRFVTQAGATRVRNTQAEIFFVSSTQDAVVVSSRKGDQLSSSSVYSHFLVNAPSSESSSLKFLGGAPGLSGFEVTHMSVDVDNANSEFSIIRNRAVGAISNAVVRIPAWAGFPSGSTFVSGNSSGV